MEEGSTGVSHEEQMMKVRERATAGKPSGPKVTQDVKRGKSKRR